MRSVRRAVILTSILTLMLMMATSAPVGASDDYRTEVRAGGAQADAKDEPGEGRAAVRVGRRQIDELQARSTPEALRWVPGVAVQQTAHGQASPYVRGLTGRRTVLLFDGLRINHALFRQGPNQYLFTVDPGALEGIGVVRGSAGVELGAGAIGGAVLAEPRRAEPSPGDGVRAETTAWYRHGTADHEHAARIESHARFGDHWAARMGFGGRSSGRLESAGHVGHLAPQDERFGPGALKDVPRLEADGRTQLGTGFDVLSGDLRVTRRLGEDGQLTAAAYAFRQFDSPRTDQCPPAEHPDDHCLMYEEQFRTHAYGKAEVGGFTGALSWQRQHERRANDLGFIVNGGRDDIDVFELRLRHTPAPYRLADGLHLRTPFGADGTSEHVSSAGWFTLVDTAVVRTDPRGQYVDGSGYRQGGAWLAPRLDVGDRLTLRTGARWAFAAADSPGEAESNTAAVDRSWTAAVFSAGAGLRALPWLRLSAGLDQGFRPPNLDDLTARQLTGQGRQLENPDLEPERSLTADLGARAHGRTWYGQLWLFRTWLADAMERRRTQCPEGDRACVAARRAPPVKLFNLPGDAVLHGWELDAGWRPVPSIELRALGAGTWGADGDGTPLSRVPPLRMGAAATWRQRGTGTYIGAAVRHAGDQDRLSEGDIVDSRIPYGGTPGHMVAQLRLGMAAGDRVRLRAVIENLLNQPWRIHGSSVLGAGTSATFTLEIVP